MCCFISYNTDTLFLSKSIDPYWSVYRISLSKANESNKQLFKTACGFPAQQCLLSFPCGFSGCVLWVKTDWRPFSVTKDVNYYSTFLTSSWRVRKHPTTSGAPSGRTWTPIAHATPYCSFRPVRTTVWLVDEQNVSLFRSVQTNIGNAVQYIHDI